VPRERIVVTPLASDARFSAAADRAHVEAFRRERGLPRHLALYVGMSEPHKNLRLLFEAAALLAKDHAPGELGVAVIGPTTGPYAAQQRAMLVQHVEQLGVADRVHFLGTLTDEELRLAYAAADVLVQPSRVEGFGLTILEAMLAGTPVACSDIPVFHEVAGDAAELFDPADARSLARALVRVMHDPARADELRVAGRRRAVGFSWGATSALTLSAYRRALGIR
jgi:glycosyltransferase involved in cell wall biosynthesis